jgi:hypothetical protein
MPVSVRPLSNSDRAERRRGERVALTLPGRYMLRDGCEYPCWTIDVSPAGVAIIGLVKGRVGERVVAYIDQLGRIEGKVARQFDASFALQMEAALPKRERLAQKIAWLVERRKSGERDNRTYQRLFPRDCRTTLTTPDGKEQLAALIDVAVPGAAITVNDCPPIGAEVMVGQTAARVVRHFLGGIAVAFANQLSAEILNEDIVL